LPRDLQRQLAALLYDASMSFRADTFASAEFLGRHLQLRCGGCSSRFRQFAENGTLLGQIGLALLLQHDDEGLLAEPSGAILHPGTLARIVADLNHERDAGQWLAEARSAARFRVRGLARIPMRSRDADTGVGGPVGGEASDKETIPLPRPRFVLRETTGDHWQVRIQLPNLAHLLGEFPRARDVLTRAQGRVGGPTGRLLARGRIVSDWWPEVTLDAWPAPETPLLAFDGAPPELEALLQAGFRINSGDHWLFHVGGDGQAREIATRLLRAGESYLLLQKTETRNPVSGFGIRALQVECSGIYGLRVDVPRDIADTLVAVLGVLGLEVAQTLDVWPVGLPAAEWGGDGTAEWVAGHPIVLGVRVDRRIARLKLTIDGVQQPDIAPDPNTPIGAPAFVQLPQLSPGGHRLALLADLTDDIPEGRPEGRRSGNASAGLQGELEFVIREPRTVAAGRVGALSFAVQPSTPSLEDVWEDRIELNVAAPGVSSLLCHMALQDRAGQQLIGRTFPVPSPCDSDSWRQEFARARRRAEDLYDEAQVCALEFDGGMLGRARIVAERDFTALRWVVRGKGDSAVLIDSQGCADLTVSTTLFAAPSIEHSSAVAEAVSGIEIDDGGALVVARSRELEAAIVVVPPQRIKDFAALSGPQAQVPDGPRDVATVAGLARMAALWERARLAGSSLAEIRRVAAVDALVGSLTGIVSGERWADAEEVFRSRGLQGVADLMRGLVASRPDERAIAVLLSERLTTVADAPMAEAENIFVDTVRPFFHIPEVEILAPFALRLAASPSQARAFVEAAVEITSADAADAREGALINDLLARPVILRAARYLVIATRTISTTRGGDLRSLPWRSG
jgi:hypothetical protein